MEVTVEQIDAALEQTARDLDERMKRAGIALERAGREFDEHLDDVERELNVKTERFEQVIEICLGSG